MKKNLLVISDLIIIIFIVAGFTGIVYRNTRAYQDLAEKQLEYIVNLADTDISHNIGNSMDKPVMVSKTMANDEFLKTWLSQEPANVDDDAYLEQLYDYLKTYQLKYGYTTVFCVSAQTGNYYYQDGLNKTVSKSDSHDVWYYNFIDSGHENDLEVDTNEANGNCVSVFVNFRVEGDDGTLLGVIGVGLKASFIEDTIRTYEKDYDMSVFLINVGGAENSFTGETDIFVSMDDLPELTGITDPIEMSESSEAAMQWFTSGNERKCLITQYDPTLGWYLVVEKDTSSISSAFQKSIRSNIVFMLISLMACIIVTTVVFINYNRRMLVIENTDELTGLWNRKLFYKKYPAFVRGGRKKKISMFMLDIDHFKNINDTYGHLVGNAVLTQIGESLRKAVGGNGIAARWGGDEFVGVLALGPDEAKLVLSRFMRELDEEEIACRCKVTVSVGLAEIAAKAGAEQMLKKVDEALYRSKEAGRNRITICEK